MGEAERFCSGFFQKFAHCGNEECTTDNRGEIVPIEDRPSAEDFERYNMHLCSDVMMDALKRECVKPQGKECHDECGMCVDEYGMPKDEPECMKCEKCLD